MIGVVALLLAIGLNGFVVGLTDWDWLDNRVGVLVGLVSATLLAGGLIAIGPLMAGVA